MHDEDARLASDERDGCKVVDWIERKRAIERRADRVRLRCKEQGVTVGRRFGDDLAPDHRARTRFILDEDLLPKPLRQVLCDHAHRAVDGAAGRKRNDDTHGPRRIVLRVQRVAAQQRGDGNRKAESAFMIPTLAAFAAVLPQRGVIRASGRPCGAHGRVRFASSRTSGASASLRQAPINSAARSAPSTGSTRP